VNYWESRREVFGDEKYTMRMTLSGALRDDMVAVGVGMHRLLPKLDSFGRKIMFIEPHRHTRQGYTSESLVSCVAPWCEFSDLRILTALILTSIPCRYARFGI